MKHIQFRPLVLSAVPSALKRSTAVLAAVLAASWLTGCQPVRAYPGLPTPQPDYFTELEPNDTPDFPDFVGYLNETSFVVVEGRVDAVGYDIVDHIEFVADQPMEIDFTLEAFGPYGDVDVSIYDPIAHQIVGTYSSAGRYEAGTLIINEAGRPFQFIIEAFGSNSDWSLELVGYPYAYGWRTAAGPDDDSDQAWNRSDPAPPPIEAKEEHDLLRLASN